MYPTARFAGNNPDRQSIGLPGHCERCAEKGHVLAHPNLGCGDVQCNSRHDEASPGRDQQTSTREQMVEKAARDALYAYADAVQENEAATYWTADNIAADVREWADEHHCATLASEGTADQQQGSN
jgi:hypothetical protein